MNETIGYKNLSGWLKALVILGWIGLIFNILWFVIAFAVGFISAL